MQPSHRSFSSQFQTVSMPLITESKIWHRSPGGGNNCCPFEHWNDCISKACLWHRYVRFASRTSV